MNELKGCAQEKARETAASVVLLMLENTAARVGKVLCIVSEKTASVTRNEPETTLGPNKAPTADRQSYPPLFDRIRELTENINGSLSGIEDIMRRCEL